MFSLLLEREEGREGRIHARQKHPLVASCMCWDHRGSYVPGLGIKPATQVSALTGNQTCNLSVMKQCSNQLSHTDQGLKFFLKTQILSQHFSSSQSSSSSLLPADWSCLNGMSASVAISSPLASGLEPCSLASLLSCSGSCLCLCS